MFSVPIVVILKRKNKLPKNRYADSSDYLVYLCEITGITWYICAK